MCRGAIAGFFAQRLLQHSSQLRHAHTSTRHLMRSTNQQTHHAVHKSVSMEAEAEYILRLLLHRGSVYTPYIEISRGIFRLVTAASSEAAEIMRSHVAEHSLFQQGDIELMREMPNTTRQKGT